MSYRLELTPHALRQLQALPPAIQRRLHPRLEALVDDPRPPQARKLAGHERRYRLRVGDYRVLYDIHDEVLLVLVIRLGHRRDIYRRE